jgi:hypothetical protein
VKKEIPNVSLLVKSKKQIPQNEFLGRCHAMPEQRAPPPPVRPVLERVRDYAIVAGGSGGLLGACLAARHGASMFVSIGLFGGSTAAAASGFIGLRYALLQDRWEEDVEAVSGLAAGAIGGIAGGFAGGARGAARTGMVCFFAGGALHFAHRWWLHWRLSRELQ